MGFLASGAASAHSPVVAAGAGYKKMVNALAAAYAERSGKQPDLIYGNMGRVTALAMESGKVDLVLGDEAFLSSSGLVFAKTHELGRGQLVLAFPAKGGFAAVEALDDEAARRIAMPDPVKAIYGKAAREFLENTGRMPAAAPRLIEVATVPQVFSYLVANEVDMGFLNLSYVLDVADKLGGYVILDQSGYAPISIMAGVLRDAPNQEAALEFIAFLRTAQAKAIIISHGL
ncbi:molybdate ABC transporter substrate-binding protein [Pseudodesulfovibrio alkaliphilus]|uniref:molybdate ABC transporter substrate-binding protein n=1 Tax=Pseudodesulfovibrio alkaliphilus TaxID=2661613 RepID=UPI00346278BD